MSWTEERIERLKKMWHEGATASQIADELGGVSRNAVIGKAHRLGLEQRPSPVKPGEEKEVKKPAAAPPAAASAQAKAAAPAKAEAPEAAPAPAPAPAGHPQRRQLTPQELQYRSIGPGGFIRQGPASSRHRSRRPRRAAWSRPSRAPRSPTRPACSISMTASANGRSAIRANPISISAAAR